MDNTNIVIDDDDGDDDNIDIDDDVDEKKSETIRLRPYYDWKVCVYRSFCLFCCFM